jgi:uncharacterized pyridoxamine 5'-phosphate oxidase family protein
MSVVEYYSFVCPEVRAVFYGEPVEQNGVVTLLDQESEGEIQVRSPTGAAVEPGRIVLILDHFSPVFKESKNNRDISLFGSDRKTFRLIRTDGTIGEATEDDITQHTAHFRDDCKHAEVVIAGSEYAEIRTRCAKCGLPIMNLYDHLTE